MHRRVPVSLIIPAHNEELVIRSCLLAAVHQTVPAHEIIVVDNRSDDATVEVVLTVQREYPHIPIILLRQHYRQGLIPTRNFGLDTATGEVLGRVDADSVLRPDWIEQVELAFQEEGVAAATGPVVYYDMPLRRFGLQADDWIRRLMLRLARNQHHFLFGSNMAIRRSSWQQIRDEVCLDLLDEMHEDIDLSLHLAEHPLSISYVRSMISGVSARRLQDSLGDYTYYVMRFERTYRTHNVRGMALRMPMVVLFSVYFPAKAIRALHTTSTSSSRTGLGRRTGTGTRRSPSSLRVGWDVADG